MEETIEYVIWNNIKITDWIKAFGVLLGIPLTIYGLRKLFIRDTTHEERLEKLEKLVDTQTTINSSLQDQLQEMANQTEALEKRNQFQIDHNRMTEANLDLNLRKYEDQTITKYKDLTEYVLELLRGLEEPITNQISGFEGAINLLSAKENQGYEIPIDPSLRITNLQNIDNHDLYRIFVQENELDRATKIDSFLKLEKALSFIEYLKMELGNDVRRIFSKYSSYESRWQTSVQSLKDSLDSIIQDNMKHGIAPSDDSFASGLDKIHDEWYSKNEEVNIRDMYYVRDHFVEPIRLLCNHNITDDRTKKLLKDCSIAEVAYSEIDNVRKQMKETIENYKSQLEKSWNNIAKSLETLSISNGE